MKATDGLSPSYDPGLLTFSQAQGYEEMPGPLKLEQLPEEARTRIWNMFFPQIKNELTGFGFTQSHQIGLVCWLPLA